MVFSCVLKNALENTFLLGFSHFPKIQNKYYYRKSQYINTKRNKNQNHMRERKRERDQFMGDLVVAAVVSTWTQWVDLRVTAWSRRRSPTMVRSRSGSFTQWSNQLKSGLLTVVRLAPGWVIHWVDMVVRSIFWGLLLRAPL